MADLERRAGRGRAEPCAAVAGVPLVVLGSSTGGPEALRRILTAPELPRSAAYVAIQHLDGAFFGKLATWLDGEVPLEVCAVQRGVGPAAGRVLMPSSDTHLELGAAGGIVPARADCGSPYRPCIDVFFRSVAERWPGRVVGVLLTGMGRDGAEGLLELRRAGAHTIAQDPETCSAPGMPRAAIELGAVAEIAPIEGIGSAVGRALRRQPAQRQSTR